MRTLLVCGALLTLLTQAAVASDYHARGVFYIDGIIRSPLAGIGSRGDLSTNRLALDDEYSTVEVDPQAHRIVFANDHPYKSNSVIGDLVLLASGTNRRGEQVPCAVHLKVEKHGDTFSADIHPHPTAREALDDVRLEPYTVSARGAKGDVILMTPEAARRAIEQPELAARLANIFMQATDHLEGQAILANVPDARLVDVSIGFGLKQGNLKVGRIELISNDPANAPLIRQGSVAEMLARGTWEFRITSLTWLPPEEFTRDLFLFGLDSIPFLQRLKRDGLRRNESLIIGLRDGHGYVQLGKDRAEIIHPEDVARAYLEFHFIGGIVARQVADLPRRLAAPTPPR